MSCNTMRDLEYEREKEEERKRKKRKDELKRQLKQKQKEEKRRIKALETIKTQAARGQWLLSEAHPNKFVMYKPYTKDRMVIEVFPDGRVRVDTPGVISPQNHPSADAFMANLAQMLGGTWKVVKRHLVAANQGIPGAHSHAHGHTHTH